jgi:hypothetical protein
MDRRFIGVMRFDAITTFAEFQVIAMSLLRYGFDVEVVKEPRGSKGVILPWYSAWRLEITRTGDDDGLQENKGWNDGRRKRKQK